MDRLRECCHWLEYCGDCSWCLCFRSCRCKMSTTLLLLYALGIWSVRLELEELWDGQDIREEVVEMQPPPAVLADVNPPSYEEVISKNPWTAKLSTAMKYIRGTSLCGAYERTEVLVPSQDHDLEYRWTKWLRIHIFSLSLYLHPSASSMK